jgi:hypothetical protein
VARADYKGSWARNSPDWLVESACSVGANNPGAVGLFACTDLFNESQSGQYLWVYAITLFNFGSGSIRVQGVQGNCGGVSGPGYALVVGQAPAAGTLFINQVASNPRPNTDPYITSASQSPVIDVIEPGGPIMVVPPGYSLRLVSNQTQFGFVGWLYYVVKGGTR